MLFLLQTLQKIDRAMQHRENTKQSNITVNTKICKSGSNISNEIKMSKSDQ